MLKCCVRILNNLVLLPLIIGAEEMGVILAGLIISAEARLTRAGPICQLIHRDFQTFCLNVDFPN